MRQATTVVRSNPSLAFKINLVVKIIMYASFLQLMESCQEESMDNLHLFISNYSLYYQHFISQGKIYQLVFLLTSVSVGKNTLK